MNLKIEQSLIISDLKLNLLKRIASNTNNKNLADQTKLVKKLLPTLKIGYGGSHIWISNKSNERLAIIK